MTIATYVHTFNLKHVAQYWTRSLIYLRGAGVDNEMGISLLYNISAIKN